MNPVSHISSIAGFMALASVSLFSHADQANWTAPNLNSAGVAGAVVSSSGHAVFELDASDLNPPSGQTFLVTERNASSIWEWDPVSGATSVFHSERSNDADFNPSQGSSHGWLAEHFNDFFARFDVGSGSGLNAQYTLGQGGLTHYHYPKHIAVFDNAVVVMSRNDGTIWRYTIDGIQVMSRATGFSIGQGLATDGTDLYVSVWTGSASLFLRYDTGLNQIGGSIPNPTGMGNNTNIFDFAYDSASGHWFGLVTDFEGGTPTATDQVIEFTMGGSVVATYALPFMADGFGLAGESAGPCYADCDQSTGVGVLDLFDFLCFQNSFVNGETYACDCDTSTGPLVCDVLDFLCFQNAFVGGCP